MSEHPYDECKRCSGGDICTKNGHISPLPKERCEDFVARPPMMPAWPYEVEIDHLRQANAALLAEVERLREAWEADEALLKSTGIQTACIMAWNHGYAVTPEQQSILDRAEQARAALRGTNDDR